MRVRGPCGIVYLIMANVILTDPGTTWPPPDPDRLVRFTMNTDSSNPFTQSMDPADFRKRQEADFQRQRHSTSVSNATVQRRQPFHLRYGDEGVLDQRDRSNGHDGDNHSSDISDDDVVASEGEEGWRNSEGERLADFGVEEETEFYDEDDVPLAEIIRAKRYQRSVERAGISN